MAIHQSLHQISIPGPSLASLLHDFSSSHGDCDGILFGRFTTTISSHLDDSDEVSLPREDLNAFITGFCSSGTSLSFYDSCGRINRNKLSRLVGPRESRNGDPVIGWFIGRRNTPMRPSIRDMAVTRSLAASAKEPSSSESDGAPSTDRNKILDKASYEADISESATHSSPSHGGGGRLNWRSSTDTGSSQDSSAMHPHPLSPKESNVMGQPASPKDTNVIEQLQSLNGPCEKGVSTSLPDIAATFCDQLASPKDGKSKPSLRETCATSCDESFQSSSTVLFMILTELGMGQPVHTHDYRVYQYHFQTQIFEQKTLKIINIGPVFRHQYDAFAPNSAFPLFPSPVGTEAGDNSHDNSQTKSNSDQLYDDGAKNASVPFQNEQALLDMYSEGYKMDRLTRLLHPNGKQHVVELEDLYSKMLLKLESLAKQVSDSSSKLFQQEMRNRKLRQKKTGQIISSPQPPVP